MINDIIIKQIKKDALVFKKISAKSHVSDKDACEGYLIDADEKEVRRIVDSLKNSEKNIAVVGRDDIFNRRVLETCKIDYLVGVEGGKRKDTLKQRDSGLNHVLARIAKQKKIAIVVNLSDVLEAEGKQRALVLSRIMQNVKTCRRAGCMMKIATFAERKEQLRNLHDLKAFAFSLGMSSQQVSDGFEF